MNSYQVLIPQITLLFGVFFSGILHVMDDERYSAVQWMVHTLVLFLALLQEVLLYRIPWMFFLGGGMVLDGATEILSLSVLTLALFVQLNRRPGKFVLGPQINLLTLGCTLFALLALESNRIFFGFIAVIGMIWTCQGALAAETKGDEHPDIVHSGMIRGLVFLTGGIILSLLCFASFGETQVDEIQRILSRGSAENQTALFPLQILILFLGALTMGIPPFDGLFGHARRKVSWSLSLGMTGLFAIVGFSLFVRWGLLMFARPAIGGLSFEPLTDLSIMMTIRFIGGAGLIVIPLFALLHRQLRGSLLFFALNPFVQALFAISYGQRDVMSYVMGQIFISVFTLGLLISTLSVLDLPWDFTFQRWVGIGRREKTATLSVILAAASAAGLAPFFGSQTIQKTLSINSYDVIFLLGNCLLCGIYVARLAIFAFHRAGGEGEENFSLSGRQRAWLMSQLAVLIFMGIFWQPLYNYGAFSIRSFFGEI